MRVFFIVAAILAGTAPSFAETVIAARTIRSFSILTAADLTSIADDHAGAVTRIEDAIGMEARVVLYAGRPVSVNDIGPPALVARNQIITLISRRSGLTIATEARALGRAGVGDRLRVMNLSSRNTVTGTVQEDGTVTVGGPELTAYN